MSGDSPWLTPEQVSELTGKASTSYKAQCRELAKMGIPFTPNAIGRPLVERLAVLTVEAQLLRKKKPAKGPNWDALDGKAA